LPTARYGDGADDGDHEKRARELERHERVIEQRPTEGIDASEIGGRGPLA
jgi:hypothetical protein